MTQRSLTRHAPSFPEKYTASPIVYSRRCQVPRTHYLAVNARRTMSGPGSRKYASNIFHVHKSRAVSNQMHKGQSAKTLTKAQRKLQALKLRNELRKKK